MRTVDMLHVLEPKQVREHLPGDVATYTTETAPGAWPNGSRVQLVKMLDESGLHKVGDCATVLGSMGPAPYLGEGAVFAYFVEWDDTPGLPVLVANYGGRLALVVPS